MIDLETPHRTPPPRRRKWVWLAAGGATLVVATGIAIPRLEGTLRDIAVARVREQVACLGTSSEPPQVTVFGRMLPQAWRRELDKVEISVPELTVGNVKKAAFEGTLTGAHEDGRLAGLDASITVKFASLPDPAPSFRKAGDGTIRAAFTVASTGSSSKVRAKLLLRLQLKDDTVRAVPLRLQVFGRTIDASKVSALTGGVQEVKLPELPAGVSYDAVTPRGDGIHVTLSGVNVTSLSTLPTQVDGRDLTYQVENGLLGIATEVDATEAIGLGIPLTGNLISTDVVVFTRPRIDGTRLIMDPVMVRMLGEDRDPSDRLAQIALAKIDRKDLTREMPVPPAGVAYRGVSVDPGGIRVALGGTVVRPFSDLPQPAGRPTTFGAQGGLLTASTTASTASSRGGTPIVLHAKPAIRGRTLDIAPQQIELFGTTFPAEDVLGQVKAPPTTFPLPKLPDGVGYRGVDVLDDGLRIRLSGSDVVLAKGSPDGGCPG